MAVLDPRTPLTLRDPESALALTVLPYAGMLITSLTAGGVELLGQRRGVEAYLRDGKTMGIPLLYPWANRLSEERFTVGGVALDLRGDHPGLRRDPNGLPIHGLLAASQAWEIERSPETGGAPGELLARFDFAARPELLASFPFPHLLEYRLALAGGALTLELTITATGDVPVPVAHGLHPYLTIPGLAREDWRVELPGRSHLALDSRGLPTGSASAELAWSGPLGDRAFDDAYAGIPSPAQFVVAGGDWRLETTFEAGYPAAQVFAPLADPVICFEPMAAPTNGLVSGTDLRLVQPGGRDVSRLRIAVERVTSP